MVADCFHRCSQEDVEVAFVTNGATSTSVIIRERFARDYDSHETPAVTRANVRHVSLWKSELRYAPCKIDSATCRYTNTYAKSWPRYSRRCGLLELCSRIPASLFRLLAAGNENYPRVVTFSAAEFLDLPQAKILRESSSLWINCGRNISSFIRTLFRGTKRDRDSLPHYLQGNINILEY